MSDLMIITLVNAVVVLLGSGTVGLIVKHKLDQADKLPELCNRINRISEAVDLSLESHLVTQKALREGHINGESEAQAQKIQDYFRRCASKGMQYEYGA
jgi:phosphomevalonate kinase